MKNTLRFGALLIASVSISTIAMAATPLQSTATTTAAQTTTGFQAASASGANATNTVTTAPTTAGSVNVAQFNTANGILTGATAKVKTDVSATARVTGSVNASGSGRTITSDVALAGVVAASGVSFTSGTLTASKSCSGGNCPNSPSNNAATTNGTIDASAAVPLANLAAYAGTGSVAFTRSASGSTKITNGSGAISGTADGSINFGSGTQSNNVYSIVYDYLNFASPSFDGASIVNAIDLDFGTMLAGSGPLTLNFSIFNLGDANSAGVNLDTIVRSDNNTDFTTSLATFTDLLAGSSSTYTMTFLPTAIGLNTETFTLDMSDYAPAGSVGAKTYQLKINTLGNVTAPPIVSVPEPEVWAMLIAGFGLTGLGQRRRRARGSVAA